MIGGTINVYTYSIRIGHATLVVYTINVYIRSTYAIRIGHATLVVRVQGDRIDHWVLFVVKPVCTAIATNIQCTDV